MNKGLVVTGAVALLTLLGVGVSAAYDSHQTSKKIGKTIDEIKHSSIKDIKDSILNEAVGKAADYAVDKYIRDDNDSLLKNAKQKLDHDIDILVRGRYDDVTNDVGDRLAKHVAQLDDPERLKRVVRDKAESLLVNRFEDDLNDLKRRASDAYDDANDRYEEKLEEAIDRFEDKLNDKLKSYTESLDSMKKAYDTVERAFGGRGRDSKEIRFTLG